MINLSQKMHLDFETRSRIDLTKAGSHVYAKDPSTDILCMGYCFGDGPVKIWVPTEPIPVSVVSHVREGGPVYAYNMSGFEFLIWNYICVFRYGFPKLVIEQCFDPLAMVYAMGFPGKLENAAFALGVSHAKDMAGRKMMMKLSQPRSDGTFWTPEQVPNDFKILGDYCKQDVEVERAITNRVITLSAHEQKLWVLDNKINNRGVFIDKKAVLAALKIVEVEKLRLDEEMRDATDGAVEACTNAKALANWIRYKGYTIAGVAKDDVTTLLLEDDLDPDVKRALELRQEAAKSSTAKLEAMMISLGRDSRIRGCFQYHGAATGRFAGRRVQLHNMPRPKIKQKEIESIFQILETVN